MTSLAAALRAELDIYARIRSLRQFIAATPRYAVPEHLGPYLDLLERSRRESVKAVVAAPPRHGKSESTLHYVVQSLLLDPTDRIGYATYAAEFSEQQAKRAAFIAEQHGLRLAEQRASFWRTPEGGEAIWTSIGGPLTGKGVRRLFVDDPVKGRAEAESAAYREAAWAWFNAVAYTRLEPGGSIIVMATRWHPDDLSGRLIAQGWKYINLQALSPIGAALWPARYDVAALADIREQIGEYEWASLYQGEPRSKGGRVFGDVHFYDALPAGRYRTALGADFAYSAKSHADCSVALALVEHQGLYYVADVKRERVEAPAFRATLAALKSTWKGTIRAYIGGTEKGVVDFMDLAIDAIPASADKFTRAQPVAAAWNAGKVLVPRDALWVSTLVSELAAFTGVGDKHDDQVDALSAAFDALDNHIPMAKTAPHRPGYRMGAGRGF